MDDVLLVIILGFVGLTVSIIILGIWLDRRGNKKVRVGIKKDIEEIEKVIPKRSKLTNKLGIVLNEDYLGWSGFTPFVEFDENFVQMPLSRTELKIPREHTTRMTFLAWWSGFIAGARGQTNLKMFLIIIMIGIFVIGGLTYFLESNTQTSISGLNSTVISINNRLGVIEQHTGGNYTNNTVV